MDMNFDGLVSAFKERVYDSSKGEVRINILKYDMELNIQELSEQKPLKILDAGGGMGQIARWMASKGHNVVLCDLSSEMLKIAEEENEKADLGEYISIINKPIQELPYILEKESFDLITLHGVIEWMDKPIDAFKCLIPLLKHNGKYSVLIHNLDKLILKWGINGQYDKAIAGKPCGVRKLTPFNSLSGKTFEKEIENSGLKLISKAGIRIFHGFFAKLTKDVVNDTFLLEKKYCHEEPFASLGEHTHYLLRKI